MTESNSIELLQNEVHELRRGLKRQRWINTGLMMAALVGVTTISAQTQNTNKELVCNTLRVVDNKGKTVAILGADESGGALALNSSDGTERVALATDTESGSIAFKAKNGKVQSLLSGDKDGGIFVLNSITGETMVAMAIDKEGSGVTFGDRAGNQRLVMYAEKTGGVVAAFDGKGNMYGSLPEASKISVKKK